MIINGGSRENWRFFATHLQRTDQNQRVEVKEIHGLMSTDLREALREMDAIASGTQTSNFMYHANLNPAEGETLTPEQWREAVDRLERNLGLEGHARVIVEHEKDGRTHQHVIWNRIDPDTMTAASDSFNYRKHQQTSRELEEAFGLQHVDSVHGREPGTERPERRPEDYETFRAQESKLDPKAMKAEISALWQGADSGLAFRAALEDAGYILARGDRRDFVIIDSAGDDHSFTRRTGAKAADVRERLSDIDREALPSVEEARALARAKADTSAAGAASVQPEQPADASAAPRGEAARTASEPQLRPEAEGTTASTTPGLKPAPERYEEELQAQKEATEDSPRASPWGSAWRVFADRARAFTVQLHDLLADERSGNEGSLAARVIEAGRKLWAGEAHRDAQSLAEGVKDVAAIVGEQADRKATEGQPKTWTERLREQARQLLTNERGSVAGLGISNPQEAEQQQEPAPEPSDFDRMAEEWTASIGDGEQSPEPTDDTTPEPDEPEPDGQDIEP
jgi:hypothetical protein